MFRKALKRKVMNINSRKSSKSYKVLSKISVPWIIGRKKKNEEKKDKTVHFLFFFLYFPKYYQALGPNLLGSYPMSRCLESCFFNPRWAVRGSMLVAVSVLFWVLVLGLFLRLRVLLYCCVGYNILFMLTNFVAVHFLFFF